jgi:Pyridine nucleotide-disulphide oxidoreductase, dimerisation domain
MCADPPLARVGSSEGEAQRQDAAVRAAKLPIVALLRSPTMSETRGAGQTGDDRILGFTKLGAEARQVIAVVQTAMVVAMRYTGLRNSIIAHPTMAEGLGPKPRLAGRDSANSARKSLIPVLFCRDGRFHRLGAGEREWRIAWILRSMLSWKRG